MVKTVRGSEHYSKEIYNFLVGIVIDIRNSHCVHRMKRMNEIAMPVPHTLKGGVEKEIG